MSIAARNAAASDTQSVTTSGVRDRRQTEDYETCVRRTGIAWIEIITLCICSVNFMFPRRPTGRNLRMQCVAERPVCVPYKRKNLRMNQKQSAAVLVYKNEINLTS